MDYPYCIEHGYSTRLQHSLVGDCHEVPVYNDFGVLEYEVCFYELGMAYCEMPEFRDDWDIDEYSIEDLDYVEPDWNEILQAILDGIELSEMKPYSFGSYD